MLIDSHSIYFQLKPYIQITFRDHVKHCEHLKKNKHPEKKPESKNWMYLGLYRKGIHCITLLFKSITLYSSSWWEFTLPTKNSAVRLFISKNQSAFWFEHENKKSLNIHFHLLIWALMALLIGIVIIILHVQN